jgi:hypothetical protein
LLVGKKKPVPLFHTYNTYCTVCVASFALFHLVSIISCSLTCNTNVPENLLKIFSLQKFFTMFFDQCGHHQVLKLLEDEIAVF